MTIDDKARTLLMNAWIYFWQYHTDTAFTIYGNALAVDEEGFDDIVEMAEKIIRGTDS